MKLTKLIIAAAIVASFGANAADLSQAREAASHADRIGGSVMNGLSANRHSEGRDADNGVAAAFGADRAVAHAALNGAEAEAANNNTRNAAMKAAAEGDAKGKAAAQAAGEVATARNEAAAEAAARAAGQMAGQMAADARKAAAAANSATASQAVADDGKHTNSSINVAASSLNPNTPVSVDGKKTTAGALSPNTQVEVGIDSPFEGPVRNGNGDRSHNNSHSEHGTGNGGSNAQNSRSAGGLADSHVGGGRVGGGFHY
ncbi:hypothetical protein ACLLKL_002031 [Escherichia coli]